MRRKIITATAIILAVCGILSIILLLMSDKFLAGTEEQADNDQISPAWSADESGVSVLEGVPFCSHQDKLSFKSLNVYSPSEYLSDGEKIVGNYTATDAPIIISADMTGEERQVFVGNGIVCLVLNTGSEEFEVNTPLTVTAIKAAVKYARLAISKNEIPGSAERIFVKGKAEYAGVCAVVGASGNSAAYFNYLDYCGAFSRDASDKYLSDSVAGVICTDGVYLNDMPKSELEWAVGTNKNYIEYIESIRPASADDVDLATAYETEIARLIGKSLYSYIYDRTYPSVIDGTTYADENMLITALNSDVAWITDEQDELSHKIVTITSVADFMKYRAKICGAPDITAISDTELDKMSYSDRRKFEICNPLYYLADRYNGHGTSQIATAWSISSGVFGDNSFIRDHNLACAVLSSKKDAKVTVSERWEKSAATTPVEISDWILKTVTPDKESVQQ